MFWIKTIPFAQATGKLAEIYQRVVGPNGNLDNILEAHALRPHTLTGHMTLYKNVLHHSGNALPKWFLETIGVYVSLLNRCDYCYEHHFSGLRRLVGDETRAADLLQAMRDHAFEGVVEPRFAAAMPYVRQLTVAPGTMTADLVEAMRAAGLDDGEILEINQVSAYFAYANRTVLGLGVDTQGDILGLSPNDSDDPANWSHA
jgi:uncharacterized peroxidase-related enzyme